MPPVQWTKTLSLDRNSAPPVFHRFLDQNDERKEKEDNEEAKQHNGSFLYTEKLKKNLEDTRQAFKNFCMTEESQNSEPKTMTTADNIERKPPCKRISFKIKKTASIYRKNQLRMNTVAELTNKFNELQNKHSDVKVSNLVKRVNSIRNEDAIKVFRKPSVKMKPIFRTEDKFQYVKKPVTRRASVKTKTPKATVDKVFTTSAKIEIVDKTPARKTSTVKETIEIFENKRKSLEIVPPAAQKMPKPKIPDKNVVLKMLRKSPVKHVTLTDITHSKTETEKDNVSHNVTVKTVENSTNVNAQPKVSYLHSQSTKQSIGTSTTDTVKINNNTTRTTISIEITNAHHDDSIVEVLNLPTLPPKKCDSKQETHKKLTLPPKSLAISNKIPEEPLNSNDMKPNTSFLWRRNSQDRSPHKDAAFVPEPVADPKVLIEKMNEKEEELCVPPRNIPKITVSRPPTPPPKNFKRKMPLPDDYEQMDLDGYEELSPNYEDLKEEDGYEYCRNPDEENIYETLPLRKSPPPPLLPRRQEEPLPPRPPSRNSYSSSTVVESVVSNCYESIYSSSKTTGDDTYESIYGCQNKTSWSSASNRDSIVSSEHQSNSLYGRSISWAEEVFNAYNDKASSDLSCSDKSDDWVDLTDNEEEAKVQGFVM